MSARLVLAALAVAVCATLSVNGFAISDSTSDEGPDMVESLERQCLERTGSTETFEKLVAGISFAPICFAGHLDLDGLASDFWMLDDSKRVQFFDTYCPQVNESLQCISPLFELLRTCWDGEELAILDTMYNMIPAALNLICKDHGEIFFRLSEPPYDECVGKFDAYATECSSMISNTTETFHLSKLDQGQCRELSNFRGCIADKLDICKASGIMDLVDIFYKPMVKSSACAKYINLEQHTAVETNEI